MYRYLSTLKSEMGKDTFYFSCFNPNGRYKLNLAVPVQRQVAKNLMALNKLVQQRIVAKEIVDQS